MQKFIPIGNRVIVKKYAPPLEPAKLIIPNENLEMKEAVVVEVGPGHG